MDDWAEDQTKIKKDESNYKKIDPPKPFESYNIMKQFAESLPKGVKLRIELTQALNKQKPFQHFKFVIDHAGEYRQKWFDFKNEKLVEYVKNILKSIATN